MTTQPMTDAQYIKAGGGVCPFCGSSDLSGGFVEIEGTKAFQPVGCMQCDKSWVDEYALQGYIPKDE